LAPDKAGTAFAASFFGFAIIIMIVPQGLDYNGDNGMPTSSDALEPIYLVFLLGAGIFGLAMRLKRTMVLRALVNPFLLGFMALAVVSIVCQSILASPSAGCCVLAPS